MHLHTRRKTAEIFTEVPCAGVKRDEPAQPRTPTWDEVSGDTPDLRNLFCYDVWSLTFRCTGAQYPTLLPLQLSTAPHTPLIYTPLNSKNAVRAS